MQKFAKELVNESDNIFRPDIRVFDLPDDTMEYRFYVVIPDLQNETIPIFRVRAKPRASNYVIELPSKSNHRVMTLKGQGEQSLIEHIKTVITGNEVSEVLSDFYVRVITKRKVSDSWREV